jgi:hypothetical protein
VSTLRLTLGWLGWDKRRIDQEARSLGDQFGWGWLNGQSWLEPRLGSGRDHRFSFEGFFTAPRRHPVVLAALEFGTPLGRDPWIYCFNVFEHGRMAATNLVVREFTHVHVVHPNGMLNICPYKEIMQQYQDVLKDQE